MLPLANIKVMVKKTLYFGNPAKLSLKLRQLVIKRVMLDGHEDVMSRPIEDIGVVIVDNPQITFTSGVVDALLANNCAVVTCDGRHMPAGLLLPLNGNTVQNERFRQQISASIPLLKQLWQQTVRRKIKNQAIVLEACLGESHPCMHVWADCVKSGDSENMEARAAAYYWKCMYAAIDGFARGRDGMPPNNLLNYGYAILRAVVARSLVGSGLLPTLGIHHHNRYNAFCLADDIMEPYRPYVDRLVFDMYHKYKVGDELGEMTKEMKAELLSIPTLDVIMDGKKHPLMVATELTASSLNKCFAGELRRMAYPMCADDR